VVALLLSLERWLTQRRVASSPTLSPSI